jgi:hypothetical protein
MLVVSGGDYLLFPLINIRDLTPTSKILVSGIQTVLTTFDFLFDPEFDVHATL